ncbi:hypothetical protein VCHA40P242_10308 [Vibrio chagasii]|nr:hypothetical protein VCHA36P164_30240 [Vibrio chagasii]CAH7009780.1 hypothetical protein VCHA40P242_10308 [Vibrio chagasii]
MLNIYYLIVCLGAHKKCTLDLVKNNNSRSCDEYCSETL